MRSFNDHRQIAQSFFNQGLAATWDRDRAIEKYMQALSAMDYINSKEDADLRLLIRTYRNLAACYYNKYNFKETVNYYKQSLLYYPVIMQKNDEDYRIFIKNSIDLCDAYLELNKIEMTGSIKYLPLAAEIFRNCIPVFNQIIKKDEQEKKLGNIYQNPKAFYDYYDDLTTSRTYLDSSHYKSIRQDTVLFGPQNADQLAEMFNLVLNMNDSTQTQTLQQPQQLSTNNPWSFYQPHRADSSIDANAMEIDDEQRNNLSQ